LSGTILDQIEALQVKNAKLGKQVQVLLAACKTARQHAYSHRCGGLQWLVDALDDAISQVEGADAQVS